MTQITRRGFLERSVAGIAATTGIEPLLADAAHAAATTSPSERVNVALIGCGGMGIGDLRTFFLNPEVDCSMVCDVDDAHTAQAVELVEAQRGHKPEMVKDYRRVLERKDVDACIVATPDHWHALPTVLACQAGKDVYCEKPLAKTIEEGRAMREAARENKRVVQMGTQWRSGDHFRDAVSFVQSGKLGKVRQVRAWAYLDWVGAIGSPPDEPVPAGVDYDLWLGPAPQRPFNKNRFHFNFRWYWDYAGGLMTDWGVHLLNIALWAMGPEAPKTAYSSGGKRIIDDNTETPDTQAAVYDFPNYTLMWEHQVLGGVPIDGRTNGVSFCGAEGTLIVDANGWEIVPEPKKTTLEAAKHAGNPEPRPAHVRNFLDCIKSREQPVENLDVGHFVTSVAHLGNLALRTGSVVGWDSKDERVIGNAVAAELARATYRAPWSLPYART